MNNAEQKVSNYFSNAKRNVKGNLKNIYDDIYSKAVTQTPDNIAVTIISEESEQINRYIRTVRQQLKNAAIEAIDNFGISESYSEIIWAKVMNSVGVPSVQLCSSEDISITHNTKNRANASASSARRTNGQINNLQRKQMIFGGVAIAGAVAETITLLIVPGFGGFAGVLKIAELLVVGVGVAGVIKTQKDITEINRIYTEEKRIQERQSNAETVVKEVCSKQCEYNSSIINSWIDRVYSEFIDICHSYL